MTTKAPRDSLGGQVRLGAGESTSSNIDFRWAGDLGHDWYLKAVASRQRTDGFSGSRFDSVEYGVPCDPSADPPVVKDCLPLDNPMFTELPEDKIDIMEFNVRLDKYTANGSAFTFEYGTTEYAGPVFINATGRGQIRDVEKPWARFNFNNDHWNVLGYWNSRDAEAVNLNTAGPFLMDAENYSVQVQTHWDLAEDKVRIVGGGSYFDEKVDSNALLGEEDTDQQALFAQVDWKPIGSLKLVGALRWDGGSLHESQVSPKASVLYSFNPKHTVRVSYNEGFQLPTYAEYFLYFKLDDLDLSSLESDICTPAGVDCGLGSPVPMGILGNESLELEETTAYEVGYKGVIGRNALLTIDLFESKNENFVTPVVPQLTPAGRTNPDYGAWTPPEGVSADIADDVRDGSTSLVPPGSELTQSSTRRTFHPVPRLRPPSARSIHAAGTLASITSSPRAGASGPPIPGSISTSREKWPPPWRTRCSRMRRSDKASLGILLRRGSLGREPSRSLGRRLQVDQQHRFRGPGGFVHHRGPERQLRAGGPVEGRSSTSRICFNDEHWEAWGSDLLERQAMAYLVYIW